jgi:phytoene desaturase
VSAPTAIVVGAGVGGLTAAMRLQHQGFRVTLFEKQPGPGGRCGEVRLGAYRFDLGPTLLLMPHVLEAAFQAVGRRLQDYLTLHRCDPLYRVHFHDGARVTLHRDAERTRQELERLEPGSFERYRRFLEAGRRKHDVAFDRFVTRHFDSLLQFIAPELLRVGAFDSLAGQVARFFKSPHLRQAFSFQTMYLGLAPRQAPSVFSLLPYTEAEHGIWFPEGGLHAVARALERVCREEGVELHYRAPVRRVLVEHGAAAGVELMNGTVHRADVVLCNADYAWASTHLLPERIAARRKTKLGRARFTSSGLMFYWGLSKRSEALLHHSVFFGADFDGSFADIFQRGRVPAEPSFYVNAPARTDAAFAPPGHDALYVLVPVPSRPADIDWRAEAARVRQRVLARLQREGYGDLAPHVVEERVVTPHDWESELNLERGANFGLAQSLLQLGPFRPKVRDDEVPRLYWCGASIQPGTGVPTVMLSAGFAADAVLSDRSKRERKAA